MLLKRTLDGGSSSCRRFANLADSCDSEWPRHWTSKRFGRVTGASYLRSTGLQRADVPADPIVVRELILRATAYSGCDPRSPWQVESARTTTLFLRLMFSCLASCAVDIWDASMGVSWNAFSWCVLAVSAAEISVWCW